MGVHVLPVLMVMKFVTKMVDKDRKNRVHVTNVRGNKDSFYVVLSDGSEIAWSVWVSTRADWVESKIKDWVEGRV